MCYASSKDFGWDARKETSRGSEPHKEPRPETQPDRPEPHYTAKDFTFWAFPRWRKTHEAEEPAAERSHERV
jgi:hypothetical protein